MHSLCPESNVRRVNTDGKTFQCIEKRVDVVRRKICRNCRMIFFYVGGLEKIDLDLSLE